MEDLLLLGILVTLIIIAHNIKVVGEKIEKNLAGESHSNGNDEK